MGRVCKECGSEPVGHRLVYLTVAIDEAMRPLLSPGPTTRLLARPFFAFERAFTPLLMKALLFVRLGHTLSEPDERTLLLAKVIWEEAKRRGIEMKEIRLFSLPRNIFMARLKDGGDIVFEGMPLPERATDQAWWLDNKAEMKKQFKTKHIVVAKGGGAKTLKEAKTIFKEIGAPAIVKPYSGSGSRHTTLHIQTELELERAFTIAKMVAPVALVEEELKGPVFRATVVDGVCAGVLRRDPPHVVGDGEHTIEELIAKANEHPKREGPYYSKIYLSPEAHQELLWQKLTPTDIPEKGRRVTLHQKVNWGLGGTTEDVTDITHKENIELFEKAAKMLAAPLVGIDFIIEDISRSYKEQTRAGIIECNSMPFFDNHHLPFEGEPRNVAGAIWDMYLAS